MDQHTAKNLHAQNKLTTRKPKEPQFPWYDSLWLSSYVIVKDFIQENYPQKLLEFVSAFEILRTNPAFEVKEINELFTEEQQIGIRNLIPALDKNSIKKHELFNFGRTVLQDHDYLTKLQHSITDKISELVGEQVEPCYNILSLYNNFAVLRPHMDAPFAKWTVDYCVEQSSDWPIYISNVRPWPEEWNEKEGTDWVVDIKNDPDNLFTSFELRDGKAIIFGGSSQWHYRERIEQKQKINFCHLVFFHFIPKGSASLTKPKKWAEIFGIPELADLVLDEA